MQPLVHEVILPELIKPLLGMDSDTVSKRRMAVPPEIQGKIDEVTGFAHDLWERHFKDAEMPTKVINVSRVNYLVGQVLNGGFLQFAHNCRWNKSFVDGVRSGLAAVGAVEHLVVFEGAACLIDEAYEKDGGKLDTDKSNEDKFGETIDRLEREHLSNSKLSRRLGKRVNDSWTWGDRWESAQILNARYIDGWRDVQRVPPSAYPAALDKLAGRIPDLARRIQMREDARPWEKKAIDRLVAQASLSDIWYTTFSTRNHNGKKVCAWNFTVGRTPGQGHHQVVFVDGEAIMFKGSSDQIVTRMPAPECAPGSGVARNEPQQEP
jgi:hypothetical protein